MTKVAFLGLGVMGYPMAGHLAAAGHDVSVYNRTASKAEAWVSQHGGRACKTPAEAAAGADIICACVGEDKDIEAITTGDNGAFSTMSAGAIFIDHTTASADVARRLYADADARGLQFIDAPVSGGQAGAENGKLTIMCGGDEAAFDTGKAIMSVYGARVTHMGPAGSGQLTKMVNQICIAGLLQGLSEAMAFGMNAELDMDKVLGVISGGAAQSWQMENRGATMVRDSFDFGFAVDWMRKDLRIVMEEAARNGSELPVSALVAQFYTALSNQGGGQMDTSSLIRLLNRKQN